MCERCEVTKLATQAANDRIAALIRDALAADPERANVAISLMAAITLDMIETHPFGRVVDLSLPDVIRPLLDEVRRQVPDRRRWVFGR